MRRTLAWLSVSSSALAAAAGIASAQGLDPGEVFVGASKVSIYPRPNALAGQVWEHNEAACELGPGLSPLWATETRLPWPEGPQCSPRGGCGIRPKNALTSFDAEYGLWSRSVVISDGTDTVALTLIDG